MIPEHWIPHRRGDGETIGWIDLDSAAPDVRPIDRLGRPLGAVADWHEAEQVLDELGLGFLAGKFVLTRDGDELVVRIQQVYEDRIVLGTALTDAIEDVGVQIEVPLPAPSELREL